MRCGWFSFSRRSTWPARNPVSTPRPDWKLQLLWLALAACGSALLLAVTNHITQNVASVPFLWIVPLSLYLLSFILCFDASGWYRRGLFLRLLGVMLGGMAYALAPSFTGLPIKVLIPLFCCGLFVCCMFCHGELARLKPDPAHLTTFYLMCSARRRCGCRVRRAAGTANILRVLRACTLPWDSARFWFWSFITAIRRANFAGRAGNLLGWS